MGSDLPAALAAEIVALGEAANPLLLAVLEESPAEEHDAARAGTCGDCGATHEDREWARFHAIDLLTELGSAEALDPMLKLLVRTRPEQAIHDKLVERLPEFGDAALEPTLAALAQTGKGTDAVESLCCILAVLGVRDARILQALLDLLAERPRAGAVYLAEYGDPAACPALLSVLAAWEPIGDSPEQIAWLDVLDAYTSLGGELPASIAARIVSG